MTSYHPKYEENDGEEKGVYFTPQEAGELKDLLIQLAKDRLRTDNLIKLVFLNP